MVRGCRDAKCKLSLRGIEVLHTLLPVLMLVAVFFWGMCELLWSTLEAQPMAILISLVYQHISMHKLAKAPGRMWQELLQLMLLLQC